MTCGACHPEAFRSERSGRVIGYLVAKEMTEATAKARRLYFLGAEVVFSDQPRGQARHRPGFQMMRPLYLRKGDRLLLNSATDLGTKPALADAIQSELEADGIEVAYLRPEYFEDEDP